jgi:[acyl-carrier-protein] S-malonyltransferase
MQIEKSAECGPGKVLAGLTKRIAPQLVCQALISVDAIKEF